MDNMYICTFHILKKLACNVCYNVCTKYYYIVTKYCYIVYKIIKTFDKTKCVISAFHIYYLLL